jgi:hypothetical protein
MSTSSNFLFTATRELLFTSYLKREISQRLHELESFTISKTDRHLLRQRVRQKISVIKTNTFDDIKKTVHFGILIHDLS